MCVIIFFKRLPLFLLHLFFSVLYVVTYIHVIDSVCRPNRFDWPDIEGRFQKLDLGAVSYMSSESLYRMASLKIGHSYAKVKPLKACLKKLLDEVYCDGH